MLWLDNVLLLSLSLYPILRWWLWNKHFFFLLKCSEVLPPCLILFLFKSKTLSLVTQCFILSLISFISLNVFSDHITLCCSVCLYVLLWGEENEEPYMAYSVLRDPSTSSFCRSKTLALLSFSHPEFSDPSISSFWKSSSSFGTLSPLSFSRSKYSLNFLLSRFCNYH